MKTVWFCFPNLRVHIVCQPRKFHVCSLVGSALEVLQKPKSCTKREYYKVMYGTIGSQYLQAGDIILKIGDRSTTKLTVREAEEFILMAGNSLDLLVRKKSSKIAYSAVSFPATPALRSTNLNSFYSFLNETSNSQRSSTLRSTPSATGSSGTYWTQQLPDAGEPQRGPRNWGQQCSNLSSLSLVSPEKNISIPLDPSSQNNFPLKNNYPNSSWPIPPSPQSSLLAPGTGRIHSWRDKQKALLLPETRGIQSWGDKQNIAKKDYETGVSRVIQRQVYRSDENIDRRYSNVPLQLRGSLNKDKNPFTYTPLGINLTEIKSTRLTNRIIKNQQDPVVAAWFKPQRGSRQFVQDEVPLPSVATRQPVLSATEKHPALTSLSYLVGSKVNPQTQKITIPSYNSPLGLLSTENTLNDYESQAEDTIRQLEWLLLANNNQDPRPYKSQEHNPMRTHGACHDIDFQDSRNFGQSHVLQRLIYTDDNKRNEESSIPTNLKEHEMRVSGVKRERIPSRAFQNFTRSTESESETTPSDDHYDNSEQFDKIAIEPRYKGGNIPSHAFKILQEMTGTSEGEGESLQTTFQPNRTYKTQDHEFEFQKPHVKPKPEVPASQLPSEPEPKKYTGGKIPSRSFRLLQTLTGENPGYEGTDF
ncbi:uncharacterized protein LOC106457600 isoform X2 [Limulus polyphemus]|uniref:Uncharacterized protein LOC106457600 isoform X2 n=1 Tax=Limulus polyphemus TaxID=6850 RepID=A0ABM1S6P3_LIMPO|nr:uncharacterized protein LOC106457600 isoform X2 [Limulus polyphemus]